MVGQDHPKDASLPRGLAVNEQHYKTQFFVFLQPWPAAFPPLAASAAQMAQPCQHRASNHFIPMTAARFLMI